jgi:lipid A 3-O-deacylase
VRWGWGLAITFALAVSVPAGAVGEEPPDSPFRFGGWHFGFTTGWGHGMELGNGDASSLDYLALLPHAAVGLTDPMAPGSWYGGNVELVVEPSFLVSFDPDDGHAEGLGLLLRYNFLRGERFVPYLEAGAGIVNLDFDIQGQRDGFNFTPQGGAGFHYFIGERTALQLGYRFHHISNAYTRSPNEGINSHLTLVGFTLFH